MLNTTIDTLGKWAKKEETLKNWMVPHLSRLTKDDRKSVNKKASKMLQTLQ